MTSMTRTNSASDLALRVWMANCVSVMAEMVHLCQLASLIVVDKMKHGLRHS